METIQHKTVAVNGINMHVAEIGSGPAILFLHGFPELWYSWRHQLPFFSSKNYRAIAPDLRGYGDSDAPPSPASYTVFHVVGDLVALLDQLGIEQVFLVGHDWGAVIAWYFCLFRPDRIKCLVNMSVTFMPRNPMRKPVDGMRLAFGDDFYMCRFQEPGDIEEEFGRVDTAKLLEKILTSRDPKPTCIPKGAYERALKSDHPITLPSWLSEEDINYYASKYRQTGFTGGANYYRALDLNWELTGAWTGTQVKVPTKFVMGDLDMTYNFPGTKNYIHNGGFKKDVPLLDEVVILEGVGHFLHQERPDEINRLILDFIQKF